MVSGKFYSWLLAAWLICGAGALFAKNFEAPAEGPVAFRRDRMPLDTDTMAGLSRQLVTLSQGLTMGSDVNRHAIAQMLALATALDPGNVRARDLIGICENGGPRGAADPVLVDKSRSRVWQLLAWLETAEAGSQGRALAACLTDILIVADAANPRSEALAAAGEHGAWAGWVPELAAYQPKAEVKLKPPEITKPNETKSGVLLEKAQVFTMLWKRMGTTEPARWLQAPAAIQMTAERIRAEEGAGKPFALIIHAPADMGAVTGLVPTITRLLKNQHNSLPAGLRVTVGGDALDMSLRSGKRQSISAAAAVLASAAISGREPDATILGTVDETGVFKLPSGFWNQLQAMGPGNGGRLILPAAAAEYLPSMLALEKPQFFLDYEVLLASNFQELLDLSAKTPAEPLAKVSAQFREIRDKIGAVPLGQYVANSFVRRRFVDIVQAAPDHFSAKMLALQGAGNRPAFLPRVVLASELRRAIESADWLTKPGDPALQEADLDRISTTYDTCHLQVERLVRYAEKNDKELFVSVQDLITTLRSLDRAAKARGEAYLIMSGVQSAHVAVTRAYAKVNEELTAAEKETVPDR